MLDFHLRKTRVLAILMAFFLFLPCIGAFAQTSATNFNFKVTAITGGVNVANAKVIVWDKHSSPVRYGMGLTNSTGETTVLLPAITPSPSSTSNPNPNIGVLVIPDQNKADSILTWKIGEDITYFNMFGMIATDPTIHNISLDDGVKIDINPQKDGVANCDNGLSISIPGVPSSFRRIANVSGSQINTVTPSFSIYWPTDTSVMASLGGDGNYSNTTVQDYYVSKQQSFQVAATNEPFIINLEKQTKVALTFQLTDADGNADTNAISSFQWKPASYGNWAYNSTPGTTNGSITIFLAKGFYDFRAQPQGQVDYKNYPLYVFPSEEVKVDRPLKLNPAKGHVISGNIKLETTTAGTFANVDFATGVQVVAYQKSVNGGYESWTEILRTYVQSNGTFEFDTLFAPENDYRFVLNRPSVYYGGILDTQDMPTSPAKLYGFPEAVRVNGLIADKSNVDFECPRAPLFQVTITDSTSSGYTRGSVAVGYLPEPTSPGYSAYDIAIGYNTFIVPFANVGRNVVVRAEFGLPDNSSQPLSIMTSDPKMQIATTTVMTVDFDPANYVQVAGNVVFDGKQYIGGGKVLVSPVIPPANGLPSVPLTGPLGNFYSKELATDLGNSSFDFRLEKDQLYTFNVVPGESPLPLISFAPTRRMASFTANDPSFDIMLDSGVVVSANINIDNAPIPTGAQVGVAIIGKGQNDYGQWTEERRVGVASGSASEPDFIVAGISEGNYDVVFNFSGNTDPNNPNYTTQTMPLIARSFFADRNETTMEFNLFTNVFGQLNATVKDDKDKAIAGIEFDIRNRDNNLVVFRCHTDAAGKVIDGASQPIKLEAGDYSLEVKNAWDSYDFSSFSPQFHITAANMKTLDIVLPRKLQLTGVVVAAGLDPDTLGGSIINAEGINLGELHFWDPVTYDLTATFTKSIPAGNNTFAFTHGPAFSHEHRTPVVGVPTGTVFIENYALDIATGSHNFVQPSKMNDLRINSFDVDGSPIGNAPMAIVFLVEKNQGIEGPYAILTGWNNLTTSDAGKVDFSFPDVPAQYPNGAFALMPQDAGWHYDPIAIPAQKLVYLPEDVIATDTINIFWKRLATVTVSIADTNIEPDAPQKFVGMLIRKQVLDGEFIDGEMPDMSEGTDQDMQDTMAPIYAPFIDGEFTFTKVRPGYEYVCLIYKSIDAIASPTTAFDPDYQSYNSPRYKVVLRHVSKTLMVDRSVIEFEIENLMPVAPLTVVTGPENFVNAENAERLKIAFTKSPTNTAGEIKIPMVFNWNAYKPYHSLSLPYLYGDVDGFSIENPNKLDPSQQNYWPTKKENPPTIYGELPTTIMVPANRALSIGFITTNTIATSTMARYLSKVDENVIVPPNGLAHAVNLTKLNLFAGSFFDRSDTPRSGMLMLLPDGADVNNPANLTFIRAENGSFNGFLAAGNYVGYAVPDVGAPAFIRTMVDAGDSNVLDVTLPEGVTVTGQIIASETAMGIPGSQVVIMRKLASQSELLDGHEFFPYPAFNGTHVLPCDPEGNFIFEAETGVVYYVDAFAPGFRSGAPRKLALVSTTAPEKLVVRLTPGANLEGNVQDEGGSPVMAYVEAMPSTKNAISGQFVEDSSTLSADTDENGAFVLYGADPAIAYDVTIMPDPTKGLAEKVITNVFANQPEKLENIKLAAGHIIVGQLVDENDNPLAVAGVGVNIVMDLPAISNSQTANLRASVRTMQSVRAQDVGDPSYINSVKHEMYAVTDQNGSFRIIGVPEFMFAFIRTEKGFNVNEIEYGSGRTPVFLGDSLTTSPLTKNITIPLGGKVVGKLMDIKGNPIANANVEIYSDDVWAETKSGSDGIFVLPGMTPAVSYMLNVEADRYVALYKPSISVLPSVTTDLDSLVMYQSVPVNGYVKNIKPIIERNFPFGMSENHGLLNVAVDADANMTDEDFLSSNFMRRITGSKDLIWDPSAVPESLNFLMETKAGKSHMGLIMFDESPMTGQTLVSWGWEIGLNIPTIEQIGDGNFDLPTENEIVCPTDFGAIHGMLTHAIDTSAQFNKSDAVIMLYPVNASGTLIQVPFPTAITRATGGMWFVDGVPFGKYRIKVITRRYGTQFFRDIVEINETMAISNLQIGNAVKRVHGKVIVSGTTPISSARVSLIAEGISTSTDASGEFSFYLPAGEHVMPQLEVRKLGYEVLKQFSFTNVATDGVKLVEDIDLGNIELVPAPGVFTVTVMGGDTNKPLIGAEVTMVSKMLVDKMDVWTVAQKLSTDAGGQVTFRGVPAGKEMLFRARAHYYGVGSYTYLATENVGGVKRHSVTLAKATPKVFYTGRLAPISAGNANLNFKGRFDFNQVVTKSAVGLEINDLDMTTNANLKFPDLIGSKITNMVYDGPIASAATVVASVTYGLTPATTVQIGYFDLLGGALFRREFPVDPMSEDGFTGRKIDPNGNTLPTGLSVPSGYLNPAINAFELNEAEPTKEEAELASFSSPIFEFTFNDGSNAAAGSGDDHKGLFEVTLPYAAGTKLEPMWKMDDGSWSRVGIIPGSTKWDIPSAGYVTFKVSHLTKFAVLANVDGSTSGLRGDFDNNGEITIEDVAYELAWISARDQTDKAKISTSAASLVSTVSSHTLVYLPKLSIDNINGDDKIDESDVAFTLSWISARNRADVAKIKTSALSLYSSLVGAISNMFPGDAVTR